MFPLIDFKVFLRSPKERETKKLQIHVQLFLSFFLGEGGVLIQTLVYDNCRVKNESEISFEDLRVPKISFVFFSFEGGPGIQKIFSVFSEQQCIDIIIYCMFVYKHVYVCLPSL